MLKTISCGELRKQHVGENVTLAGWVHRRRDHGNLVFIDLRDREGLVQVVFNPEVAADAHEVVDRVRNEWVLQVSGRVERRPQDTENLNLPTGEVEVMAESATVLGRVQDPAVLRQRRGRGRRAAAPPVPLHRPAQAPDA